MKKLLFTVLSFLSLAATTKAADTEYWVYKDGQFGPSLTYQDWWKALVNQTADNPNGTTKVLEFRPSDGGADASCGWETAGDLNTGKCHNATLNYSWYAEGTGDYTIRLTGGGKEYNYKFSVTADNAGKWNTNSFNVNIEFPELSTAWDNNASEGKGYIFSIIVANGNDAVIYFDNVYYTGIDDSWTAPVIEEKKPTTVPTPTQNAADVASLFSSAYTPVTTFGIGSWGQTTQAEVEKIDGKDVYECKYFNYLGWELSDNINISDYDYMHVDFWSATEGAQLGVTPIFSNGEESIAQNVVVGEWNQFDIPLTVWSSTGKNLSDVFQIKFDKGVPGQKCYIANVYFWKDENKEIDPDPDPEPPVVEPGDEAVWYGSAMYPEPAGWQIDYKFVANSDKTFTVYANIVNKNDVLGLDAQYGATGMGIVHLDAINDGEYNYKGTSSSTYQNGDNTGFFFYLASQAGGDPRLDIEYIYGSSNEKPSVTPVPVITAEVVNVTENSADIVYNIQLPEELTDAQLVVSYQEGEGEIIEFGNNASDKLELKDLTSSTLYTYTLYASAELDGEKYDAEPLTVSFSTPRAEGDEDPIWEGKVELVIPECSYNGEVGQRLETTISYTITYNLDKTLTVEFVPSNQDFHNVVGMVPQLFVNDRHHKDFSSNTRSKVGARIDAESVKYYTATTNDTYETGETVNLKLFTAFAGGSAETENIPYLIGSSNVTTGVCIVNVEDNGLVDVYTITGVRVATGVYADEVKATLNPGLYIIGGKKVLVK